MKNDLDNNWDKFIKKYRLQKALKNVSSAIIIGIRNTGNLVVKSIIYVKDNASKIIIAIIILTSGTIVCYDKITHINIQKIESVAKVANMNSQTKLHKAQTDSLKDAAELAEKHLVETQRHNKQNEIQSNQQAADTLEEQKRQFNALHGSTSKIAGAIVGSIIAFHNNSPIYHFVIKPLGKSLISQIKRILPENNDNFVQIIRIQTSDQASYDDIHQVSYDLFNAMYQTVQENFLTIDWSDKEINLNNNKISENFLNTRELKNSKIQDKYNFLQKLRYQNSPNSNDKLNKRIDSKTTNLNKNYQLYNSPVITNVPKNTYFSSDSTDINLDLRQFKELEDEVMLVTSTSATVAGRNQNGYVLRSAWENGDYDPTVYARFDQNCGVANEYQNNHNLNELKKAASKSQLLDKDNLIKNPNSENNT